jgi:hypothetical protein
VIICVIMYVIICAIYVWMPGSSLVEYADDCSTLETYLEDP